MRPTDKAGRQRKGAIAYFYCLSCFVSGGKIEIGARLD